MCVTTLDWKKWLKLSTWKETNKLTWILNTESYLYFLMNLKSIDHKCWGFKTDSINFNWKVRRDEWAFFFFHNDKSIKRVCQHDDLSLCPNCQVQWWQYNAVVLCLTYILIYIWKTRINPCFFVVAFLQQPYLFVTSVCCICPPFMTNTDK